VACSLDEFAPGGSVKLLKYLALACGGLLLLQLLVRVYLFFRPMVTPASVRPLLDSGWRRRYRDPQRTLAPLRLIDGETVLEIGGGTGLFTCEAARQVGVSGRVLSIELQRPMIQSLVQRIRRHGVLNIDVQQADGQRLPFGDQCVDAIFMIAVLPMIPDRVGALREARRVLKPGGRLLISEELIAPEYVPPRITDGWARQAGFAPVATTHGFWAYAIVFERQP
jgi:ubiquinone/menaquinone biosynthesis C-methylase UbiE